MSEIEDTLKNLILSRYKSVREFTNTIALPYSTLDSVLKRGIGNSNISSVMKICEGLNIECEPLYHGQIQEKQQTFAAHKEDAEHWTREELLKIEEYKNLLLAARKKEL